MAIGLCTWLTATAQAKPENEAIQQQLSAGVYLALVRHDCREAIELVEAGVRLFGMNAPLACAASVAHQCLGDEKQSARWRTAYYESLSQQAVVERAECSERSALEMLMKSVPWHILPEKSFPLDGLELTPSVGPPMARFAPR